MAIALPCGEHYGCPHYACSTLSMVHFMAVALSDRIHPVSILVIAIVVFWLNGALSSAQQCYSLDLLSVLQESYLNNYTSPLLNHRQLHFIDMK